jgi:sialate O-acetylesterase
MNFGFKLLFLELVLCLVWKFSDRPADKQKIQLAPIFGDDMVLQRNQPITIWGTGTPSDRIPIYLRSLNTNTEKVEGSVKRETSSAKELSSIGKAYATVCDDGRWSAVMPSLKAGGPYSLSVGGNYPVVLKNIFVGDVWLCAGQSNMIMPLSSTDTSEYKAAQKDVQRAQTIRFFKELQSSTASSTGCVSDSDANHSWLVVNKTSIGKLPAVAYWFASETEAVTNIPIGIINCGACGSAIKSWISSQSPKSPSQMISHLMENRGPNMTSTVYNSMIEPLARFPITGVAWYQGESEIFDSTAYKDMLCLLINNWRELWHKNLPFLIVQLPGFSHSDLTPCDSFWAELREAQFQVAKTVPNTHLVVSFDTSGPNAELDPPFKQEIGHRLATIALSKIYKQRTPLQELFYHSMCIQSDKIAISFTPAKGTLSDLPNIGGFAIAGPDKKFYWADATSKDRKTVLVSSSHVPNPVAVRYAWADNPSGNLYSSDMLPVPPFRTDSWACRADKKTYDFSKF